MVDRHEDALATMVETLRLDTKDESALHLALQELHVHQIELEQQNLALREAQQALETSRDRYANLYDFAPIGYVSLDARGIIQDINLTGAALLGHERGSLIERSLANHLVKGGSRELFSFLRRAAASNSHVTGEVEITGAEADSPRVIRLDGVVATDHGGEQTCLTSLIDITERKLAEKRLQLASNVLENASEGVMITDASQRIIEVNPAFTATTGYSAEEALGRSPKMLSSRRHGKEFYGSMWEQLQDTGKWEGEIWNRRKSGEIYPAWITITHIRNAAGDINHYACIFTDISNQMQNREQLHRLAYYDALTHLPNRELFRDRFKVLVHQARRHQQSVALLFMDLDNFKDINDAQGHLFGDELLKEVAVRLRTCVRETDSLARLGGDEFTILVSELEHRNDAEAVAEKIQKALAAPFTINDNETYISTSIGISIFPNDSENIDTLIKHADTAMYSAKNSGRGSHCFFHRKLSERTVERLLIVNRLRSAIDRNRVSIYFQPQMCLRSGQISGFEALARLEQPQSGTLMPEKFIPVAEETGQIVALSERILTRAIDDWSERLSGMHDDLMPRLSVNMSSVQFRKQDVYAFVAGTLDRTGMPAGQLEVELTETVLIQETKKAAEILSALDRLGVRIAIDDFGTGYSSLNYLAQFPIHTVKIDRSFTHNLLAGHKQMFLVATVIAMSRVLDFDVVAEGVETVGQLALLHELGCDRVQGNLISCPKTASDIAVWIRQREKRTDLSH